MKLIKMIIDALIHTSEILTATSDKQVSAVPDQPMVKFNDLPLNKRAMLLAVADEYYMRVNPAIRIRTPLERWESSFARMIDDGYLKIEVTIANGGFLFIPSVWDGCEYVRMG